MKKILAFLVMFLFVLLFVGCLKEPAEPILPNSEPVSEESLEQEALVESEEAQRPDLTLTDSENTYILKKSKPDFGEAFPDKFINIVNDRIYAASGASSYGVFSADFNGENGGLLENYFFEGYPGDTQQEPENICSAGETDIFVLEKAVPKEKPWETWQTAVKTDAEGNYIANYPLAEIEDGIPFGDSIAFDKNGNFYLWSYWGKVLVFTDNFKEFYLIDCSGDLTFEKVVAFNNGNAIIKTSGGAFTFDHKNKDFGEKIELPAVNIFENSGNSEFDFLCHDFENIFGYNFEENRLEKLISFAEHEIDSEFLHSADIDESGNITVITKEIIWCEPTVYEIFYFEKES